MVEITLHLNEEAAAALSEIAAKNQKTNDEVVSDLLLTEVRRPRRPLPIGAGQYHSGQPDLARRVKDVLKQAVKDGEWP